MRRYDMNKSLEYEAKRDVYYGWPLSEQRGPSSSWFFKTLLKYCKLYCKDTKLAGFKYFVEPSSTWFDRTLWFLLYAITMPMMVYTVYCSYLDFTDNPLLTSVETESFPTQELDFPGVSICSINRISRRSAMEMANEVFAANISDLSPDEILDMVSQLGDLYDSEFQTQGHFRRIDQLLTVFYGGYYSITNVMKRLTPQCSSILLKCRFRDEDRNCSELFELRKTQDGFCCAFNYATKGDDVPLDENVDLEMEAVKVQKLTEERGLAVLLEPFLDDYFYPILPTTGWKVTIFNPHDYPDTTSGAVIDILVSPNMHRSVKMDAIMFHSKKNIKRYSLETRGCVFADEMTSLRAFYTYSDCIVDCKIAGMWKTCGCIPFFLPNGESKRVCNLEDVACLSQHKSKWTSVVPHEDLYNDEAINNETDILHCSICYPQCNYVRYVAATSVSHLKINRRIAKLMRGVEIRDQAALTLYFNTFGTTKLIQDEIYQWYDIMSNLSGICGIFVGFSLIAIIEFAYFVGLFVLELLKGPASTNGDENRTERKPPVQTIYWSELYSNSRTTKIRPERIRDFIVVRKHKRGHYLVHTRTLSNFPKPIRYHSVGCIQPSSLHSEPRSLNPHRGQVDEFLHGCSWRK